MDLKEQNSKMEEMVNCTEEDKIRLQHKLDKMMLFGEHQFIVAWFLEIFQLLKLIKYCHVSLSRKRTGTGAGDNASQTWHLWKGSLPISSRCICQESRGGEGFLSPGGRALQKSQRLGVEPKS